MGASIAYIALDLQPCHLKLRTLFFQYARKCTTRRWKAPRPKKGLAWEPWGGCRLGFHAAPRPGEKSSVAAPFVLGSQGFKFKVTSTTAVIQVPQRRSVFYRNRTRTRSVPAPGPTLPVTKSRAADFGAPIYERPGFTIVSVMEREPRQPDGFKYQ